MAKRTIRNWQKVECPDCRGIGIVQCETLDEWGYGVGWFNIANNPKRTEKKMKLSFGENKS